MRQDGRDEFEALLWGEVLLFGLLGAGLALFVAYPSLRPTYELPQLRNPRLEHGNRLARDRRDGDPRLAGSLPGRRLYQGASVGARLRPDRAGGVLRG